MDEFYCWLRTSDNLIYDCERIAFPDFDLAYDEALIRARKLGRELVSRGSDPKRFWLEISNASGQVLLAMPLATLFT
jgi:hypothetical protein